MQSAYLALLPPDVQGLVAQIEASMGREVVIRSRTSADLELIQDAALPICDCFMTDGRMHVEIALPPIGCAPHHLVHEVLHAYRKVVLQVHWLAGKDARSDRTAVRVDNDLEHLFVIPQEIAHAPEAVHYWHGHYNDKVATAIADKTSPEVARRENLLRHWLVTTLALPGWPGSRPLKEALAASGWARDAEKLVQKIQRQLLDKQLCISAAVRFLRLESTQLETRQFLVALGQCPHSPICAE